MVAGHLREKRGYYHIVITYVDYEGKKREKWSSTKLPVKNNKKKAEQLLLEARRNFSIPCAPTTEMLFTDFLEGWLKNVRPHVQDSTYSAYQTNVGVINNFFASKSLTISQVTAKHIHDFYSYLFTERKVKGHTVQHYHAIFTKSFKNAIRNDIIEKNPMDKVERPKAQKFIGSFYSVEEVNELFNVIKGTRIEFAVWVGIFYGLRRSEIVGLKWNAIDFKNKKIMIRHTVTQATIDGEYVLLSKEFTKNSSSYRTLPLIPEFEAYLLSKKKEQEQNKRLCGNCYNYEFDGYIYVDEMGNLTKPGYVTQNFELTLKNNNLRHIRLHDLRHTCASILLNNGHSLKEIQEWLGHSSYSTTANTYAHLEKNSKNNTANAMKNSGIKLIGHENQI